MNEQLCFPFGDYPRTDFYAGTINDAYRQIANYIIKNSRIVRDNAEILNAKIIVEDPTKPFITLHGRSAQRRYFAGELCYYLSGSRELAWMEHYSTRWRTSENQRLTSYSLGATIFGEGGWDRIIERLSKSKESRQAYLPLFADSADSGYPPCATGLQVVIRDGRLMMMVHMRSQDFWLGMPYDVGFFMILQQMFTMALRKAYPELLCGPYSHSVGSLHVYKQHWNKVEHMVESYQSSYETTFGHQLPPVTEYDVDQMFYDLRAYESLLRLQAEQKWSIEQDTTFSTRVRVTNHSSPLQKMLAHSLTSKPQGGIYCGKK